jgi:GDP-4-dehydro-6-deoxy-D-mannose reductase
LSEHLLACGDSVLGCSRHGGWSADVPTALAQSIDVFPWDLSAGVTPEARRRVADFAPDAIYHLAAVSVPSECGDREPSPAAVAANVAGTEALLQLAADLPSLPRVLFASSCYVYAQVTPETAVVTEDAPIDPRGGYGKTKWAAEQAVQQSGLPTVIARAFQHSGPRQSPRMILPDWARQFASDRSDPLRVVCLDTYLDLSDVRDVVRAYRSLLLSDATGVYNVGSGVARRSGDLLALLQELWGTPREVVELSPGRRQHPIADVTRLVSQTGWQPRIPLRQTLNDVLNYWIQSKE